MNKIDNRLICSKEKRDAIKATRQNTAIKRQSQNVHVYEVKIQFNKLNLSQKDELQKLFVEGKRFYNHVLNLNKNGTNLRQINSTNIKDVEHFDQNKNKVISQLEKLGSQMKQAIIQRMISNEKTIIRLVKNKKQKHGNLRFKSELTCIPLKQYGITYKFKSQNKIKVQGIHGDIRINGGKQLEFVDEFANANLIQKPDGYYIQITTYTNKSKENNKQNNNNKEVGLDFGIKTNITTSEGEKIDVSVEESERLKKLQRQMFRRTKGSNNRYKTIRLLKKEYQRIGNQKKNKVNQVIHKLKQYSTIVIQDEQIANWHRKNGMSKVVQHSCMGLIKSKLKQLPQTIVLDRYIPTTKFCPKCFKKNELSLDDRIYVCDCGYKEDRDVHAAKNMILINNLVKNNFTVPTEHREVTLVEFKTSIDNAISVINKSEH